MNKPTCAVNGVVRPGAMCAAVIVGGNLCGSEHPCEHRRMAPPDSMPHPAEPGYRSAMTLRVVAVGNDEADAILADMATERRLSTPPAVPGMAVQALAAEIIKALLADENDGGYDLTAGLFGPTFSAMVRRWAALEYAACQPVVPIDMVLHCRACGMQHIDKPESPMHTNAVHSLAGLPARGLWDNPPHRSHLCSNCGHVWRPADVATNGVAAVKTKGRDDSPLTAPEPRYAEFEIGHACADVGISDSQCESLTIALHEQRKA